MAEVLAVFFALTSCVLASFFFLMRKQAGVRVTQENDELRDSVSKLERERDEIRTSAEAMVVKVRSEADTAIRESRIRADTAIAESQKRADTAIAESYERADASIAESQKRANASIAESQKIARRTQENAQQHIQRVQAETQELVRKVRQTAHEQHTALVQKWNATIERSRRLKTLAEAEFVAEQIMGEAENARKEVQKMQRRAEWLEKRVHEIRKESEEFLKKAKWNANSHLQEAGMEAQRIIHRARMEAQRKAEEMLSEQMEKIREREAESEKLRILANAFRNTIEGYGDQYIIPAHTLIDDLAADFGHTNAGKMLEYARLRSRLLVTEGKASTCDYVEAERREKAILFLIDAFNGKVDSALAKAKNDNYGKLERRIRDGFLLVNMNGKAFRNAQITDAYLTSRLEELKWTCAALELRRKEQEEQRTIRERMRDEEKARREYEKVMREAAKEEARLLKDMEHARKMAAMKSASDAQRRKYEAMLRDLESKLEDAEKRGQRAKSLAELTKKGHVYIISNVGSFGEEVLKIGMTRRWDPKDRVNELGDASVPFRFDIHAMIPSDNAPALETALHRHFALLQVNKVNHRREFFRVPIAEVRSILESQGIGNVHWTMAAEAREYRETLKIEEDIKSNPAVRDEWLARQIQLDIEDEQLDEESLSEEYPG